MLKIESLVKQFGIKEKAEMSNWALVALFVSCDMRR
ncbi:hypothetical protein PPEP_a6010 [Pseudoalteromonas peptidolytica F12-50-A1]|uniref:Transposase n=1 Tax=Pseudoalteromonas peptidolytica F12-50-A1 TaxID=1315280 RepID=A0A8I0MY44_9GAMM|nr:hypothetical protein [Pseudoalteromonas peptidolytica F12-50-A1]